MIWRCGAGTKKKSRSLFTNASPRPWDFTPAYDASRRYIRNHMDLSDLEEMARFPPVGGAGGRGLHRGSGPG